MKRISVVGLKGGVGKSTLSVNIASALAQHNKVVGIDTDPQQTMLMWAARAEDPGFDVVFMEPKQLKSGPRGGYEVAVIDTAPRLDGRTRTILGLSDLVVLPVLPGVDFWALQRTLELFTNAAARHTRGAVVLNRVRSNTRVGRDAIAGIKELVEDYEVHACETTLADRIVFSESMIHGNSVFVHEPGSSGAEEMAALVHELVGVMEAGK